MLRSAINFLTRISGWTPIGKRVILTGGDGPFASRLDGAIATIDGVGEEKPGISELHASLANPIILNGEFICKVRLISRHVGYDGIALATTTISAYVVKQTSATEGDRGDEEKILATMDLRLQKNSGK